MPALEPLPGFTPAAAPQEIELLPAKFNDRLIAYVLDVTPFAAGFCATAFILPFKLGLPATPELAARIAGGWFGLYLFYQFIGNATGATIGKRFMGIKVVRRDGQPLGVFGSLLRAAGYALSTPFFNFGFVLALFHPESRALHDILSGSIVVEPRPKNPGEATIMFLGAVCLLVSLAAGTVYLWFSQPLPSDLLAVEKAKDGLQILAQVEEAYQQSHGAYTKSLSDLANQSGDVLKFQTAMSEIFDPNLFRLEAGKKAYRISAVAKDRKKTRVTVEGPPPALVP